MDRVLQHLDTDIGSAEELTVLYNVILTCWCSSATRSLPLTRMAMIHSRLRNNTSKVTRSVKNLRTGESLPRAAVPDTRSSVITTRTWPGPGPPPGTAGGPLG